MFKTTEVSNLKDGRCSLQADDIKAAIFNQQFPLKYTGHDFENLPPLEPDNIFSLKVTYELTESTSLNADVLHLYHITAYPSVIRYMLVYITGD